MKKSEAGGLFGMESEGLLAIKLVSSNCSLTLIFMKTGNLIERGRLSLLPCAVLSAFSRFFYVYIPPYFIPSSRTFKYGA